MSPVTLGVLAYSRRQEYAADSRAAEVTGNPVALARALTKIHRAADPKGGIFSLLYIQHERDSVADQHVIVHARIPQLLTRDPPNGRYETRTVP